GTEGVANSFQPDDVLFGKLRPYLAKVLHARGAGVCTSELLVLRSRDLLSRFLFYYLLNRGFIEVVDGSTFGSKMPRADWQFIGNLPAMIPPPDEQCAIAAFLDRETAKIDGLVEKKRRLIELLKEKRTALISRAVTKGLNPAAPMKPSGIDWLGDVPRHWDIVAYKRVCTRVDVGIAEAATHAYCDDGIPIIRSTNVKPNRLDTSDILRIERWFAESNRSKTLRAGDLVTIRTGYPGTTAVVPQELDGCQCFTLVMSSPKQTAHGPFFSWVLNSHPGESYFQMESWGSAQANISVPIVQFMQVPRPPITEQIAISEYLELETRKLDSLSAKVESVIGRLNEYRSALISAAVTGKIDVREEMAHGQEV
ncbi:MAG: restriction endonuclease subunit S, partial [Planctomycetota bacterium]|nr:restriction endonuclease subunit S [Planctomycetota bacterium]